MMRSIILLSCIICGTLAFTPAAKLNTQNKQSSPSSTAIGYLDTEDWYHSSLHQLDDLGVDSLDDDITTTTTTTTTTTKPSSSARGGDIGWGDVTVDPHTSAMDMDVVVVHHQQSEILCNNNDNNGGGGVVEIVYSFLPVAMLIVLESVVYHASHANGGGAVFPQSMFH